VDWYSKTATKPVLHTCLRSCRPFQLGICRVSHRHHNTNHHQWEHYRRFWCTLQSRYLLSETSRSYSRSWGAHYLLGLHCRWFVSYLHQYWINTACISSDTNVPQSRRNLVHPDRVGREGVLWRGNLSNCMGAKRLLDDLPVGSYFNREWSVGRKPKSVNNRILPITVHHRQFVGVLLHLFLSGFLVY